MANQEHLDILLQGVEIWNAWREKHPEIEPDLSDVNLGPPNLLSSFFQRTDLRGANLSHANLSGTNLYLADLTETDLTRANLQKSRIGWTIFGNVDLSQVKGLKTIEHGGPSYIDIQSIYKSGGNIPVTFLKGAGVDDTFIAYIRSLVGKPIEYYSCFISYSGRDEVFANRLYTDLQAKGIRCWFAPEDLKIGDKLRPRIDESIHLHDKLLLVLSASSTASQWVEQEVATALARERKEQRTVLFPIRLDNAVMEIESDWPFLIRNTRNIGDFTQWKSHDEYQKAFDRLLRDLKSEAQKTVSQDGTANGGEV